MKHSAKEVRLRMYVVAPPGTDVEISWQYEGVTPTVRQVYTAPPVKDVMHKMFDWMLEHGGQRPSRAFVSPVVEAAIRSRMEASPSAPEGAFAVVYGAAWFVDETLKADDVRFEA